MTEDTPQVQVTTSNKTSWKKIGLTVLVIIVVSGLIVGAYWFFVLNKDSDTSDLTRPVPKPNVPTATPSATPSAQKDETTDWKVFTGGIKLRAGDPTKTIEISLKYPPGYKVSEDEYGSTVISTQSYVLIVGPKNNEIGISLEYLTTTGSNNLVKNYGNIKEKTSLGDRDANKYVLNSGDIETIIYVVPKLTTDYSFHLRCIFLEFNTYNLSNDCATIASTLKFLD